MKAFLLFAVISLTNLLADYPRSFQSFEGELTIIGVSSKPGQNSPAILYYLKTNGGVRLELKLIGQKPRGLQSRAKIRVNGLRLLNTVLVKSEDISFEPMSIAETPHSLGKQNTLAILVNFSDHQDEPFTPEQIQKLMFKDVANFVKENSFSQASLIGDVAGWFTIEQSVKQCNIYDIVDLAQEAARNDGFDLDSYQRFFYMFPSNSCEWWGLGEIGSPPTNAWINGEAPDDVLSHELGHNLGMIHSNSYDCGSATLLPDPSQCFFSEYGDPFCNMGGSKMHYNAAKKAQIGWLAFGKKTPPIHYIAKGKQTFTIVPYSRQDLKPKAIKIKRNDHQFYYVEYRQPIGYDKYMTQWPEISKGVLLHLSEDDRSYLLDANPDGLLTADFSHAALKPRQSFQDPQIPLSIYVNSVNKDRAKVTVTFNKK